MFPTGESAIHVVSLGKDAGSLTNRHRLLVGVVAQHADLAVGRADEIEQHVDRRRLARAVGAEKAVDFTLLDGEIEVLDGGDRLVVGEQPGPGEPRWTSVPFCHLIDLDRSHGRRLRGTA